MHLPGKTVTDIVWEIVVLILLWTMQLYSPVSSTVAIGKIRWWNCGDPIKYFDWDILAVVTEPLLLTVWYVQYTSKLPSEGTHSKVTFCPLKAVMFWLDTFMDSAVYL